MSLASVLLGLAVLSLAAWVYLLVFHHRFWRADQYLDAGTAPVLFPPVTAIVPARNEAATIAACIQSLVSQEYAGDLQIIVVDDSSTDGTSDIARKAAQGAGRPVSVVDAPPLEPGWTGKLWALRAGLEQANADTTFVWFTDADIVHAPDTLQKLTAKTEGDSRDLVSLMVKLRTEAFWERLLVPAFVYFFQMLYPFPAVNDPNSRMAGAAGGCILIRHERLKAIGGIAAIREALIDDCALAAAVQADGGRVWLGLTTTSHSLRSSQGLGDLWRMVTRTAFTQLRYSTLLLTGTILGLSLVFLAPPITLVAAMLLDAPLTALISGLTWLMMATSYMPTLRLYDRPFAGALLLPVNALLYTAMTVHSAINHWRGASSQWKAREYVATDTLRTR